MMKKSGSVTGKTIRRTIVSGLLTTGCLIGLSVMDGSKQLSRIPVVSELFVESAHAEGIEWGAFGGCKWQLENGVLTISKSTHGDGVLGNVSPWKTDSELKKKIVEISIKPGVIANEDSSFLFANCRQVKKISGLSSLKVDNVTTMEGMFEMNSLEELDISGWNTKNVQNMTGMFYYNFDLKEIKGISDIDTSNVTTMDDMFRFDKKLELPTLEWNTSKVTTMDCMFSHNRVNQVLSLRFNTENVTNMDRMFEESDFRKLDLSSFKTDSVDSFICMFQNMEYIQTLDISNFNTEKVASAKLWSMFDHCYDLWKIKLGEKTKLDTKMGLRNVLGNRKIPGTSYWNTAPYWVALAGGTEHDPRGERNFYSTDKLIESRPAETETYVWQQSEKPDRSEVTVKPEIDLIVGQAWHPRDGFVSAVNRWGDKVEFEDVKVSGEEVDTTKPGTYNVIYTVDSKSATTKVVVKDHSVLEVKPEVTLHYGAVWDPKDAFVTASDSAGNPVDFEDVVVSGDKVDTTKPGTYNVTYTLGSKTAITKVVVADDLSTIKVKPDVSLSLGAVWDPKDAFVTACDSAGNPVDFEDVEVSGDKVDTTKPGTYNVTYTVGSKSATTKVAVKDHSALEVKPEITLHYGAVWDPQDAFVTACDSAGNPVDFEDVEVSGDKVDTTRPGTYNVTYTAGSKTAATKVVVADDLSTLEVQSDVSLSFGTAWDPKNGFVKASDSAGSPVEFDKVEVSGDKVDSAKPGKYTVTYSYGKLAKNCVVTVKPKESGGSGGTGNNNGNGNQGNSNNNSGSENSTSPIITSPDNGSGSTSENQPNPETNLPGTTQANEASKVPYKVYARRTIRLHRNVELTNPVKSYKKLPRHKAHSFKILGVAYSQNGTKRYRVKGGYITANKKLVVNQYYRSKPTRVKVIHPKGLHQYRKANLTGKIRHVKKGQVLKVKKVIKSDKATRLQLSDGSYITGNKQYTISDK